MGQITATRNLVAIKVVKHAGQLLLKMQYDLIESCLWNETSYIEQRKLLKKTCCRLTILVDQYSSKLYAIRRLILNVGQSIQYCKITDEYQWWQCVLFSISKNIQPR